MSIWKPFKSSIFVFTVPYRRKEEKSIIYKGWTKSGSIDGVQDCWIADWGSEVVMEHKRGVRCLVTDGLEFERGPRSLWSHYQDMPEFAELKKFAEECEGDVECMVMTSDKWLLASYDPEFPRLKTTITKKEIYSTLALPANATMIFPGV